MHHNKVKNGTCPYIPTIRFLQAFSLAGGHLLSGLPGLRWRMRWNGLGNKSAACYDGVFADDGLSAQDAGV